MPIARRLCALGSELGQLGSKLGVRVGKQLQFVRDRDFHGPAWRWASDVAGNYPIAKIVHGEHAADVFAGLISAFVLLANIVSFGALMFPGELHAGFPIAIWAFLIGSAIGGCWIACWTSLMPLASGIDSPTGAVLVVLSAMTGSVVQAGGGSADAAVQAVLLLFTVATVVSGALLYALGSWRLGTYLRFVPYFVVGGFLAATGWLLIGGGLFMTSGHRLSVVGITASWSAGQVLRAIAAIVVLAVLLGCRRQFKSAFALPGALMAMWIILVLILRIGGISDASSGWYFAGFGSLHSWHPISAVLHPTLTSGMFVMLLPEVIAVAFVSLVSLVTKVSSIELTRNTTADLDCELRSHGIANLIMAPFGGLTCSLQIGTSKLLEQAGSTSRRSGIVCAVALGVVALLGFDVQTYVPTVLVGGLVLFLGYSFFSEAFARPFAQRAWNDMGLALIIMVVCIQFGFLTGILAGIISACIMFAFNYARIGVVRRHVTRAQYSSYVDRSARAMRHLREVGERVQIYWLAGYIFFGSSERLFERIRREIGQSREGGSFVLLDFKDVPGTDTSAVVSLVKLRSYCTTRNISLVCTGLDAHHVVALEQRGLFGSGVRHKLFADLNSGLSYCEEQLLQQARVETPWDAQSFEDWLAGQLGSAADSAIALGYLTFNVVASAHVLYRQDDPATTIDLVAAGNLVVQVASKDGRTVRIRKLATHTIVGEMGFFRNANRSATIASDGPVSFYTLTRQSFERMRQDHPAVALAFSEFIIRVLSDRLEFSNRTIEALSR